MLSGLVAEDGAAEGVQMGGWGSSMSGKLQ
jgi:hypothetical protein